MKLAKTVKLLQLFVALLLAWLAAGTAEAATETLRYVITRNGDQIGTHTLEINRSGTETSVSVSTELTVKVLFVTAYHFQHTASERWVNGHLVSLSSTTDKNGTQYKVTVTLKASGLELDAAGRLARIDPNIIPSSLWNAEILRRTAMLDTQEGEVLPLSVVDGGVDEVTVRNQTVKAHRYTLKSKFTQDVWYDERQHLVQAKFLGSDGSVIMYKAN
jgi:hypothetical protein